MAPIVSATQSKPVETLTPSTHTALPSATVTPLPSATATPVPTETPTLSPALTPTPQFTMCSPLAWETIPEIFEIVSDPYHPPPIVRAEERHHGVDFSHYQRKGYKTIEGEPIQAVLPGFAVAVVYDRLPYGNMIVIETTGEQLPETLAAEIGLGQGESLYLLYAHFQSSPLASQGDPVICGQELGKVGTSGYNIVNAHLHLETRFGQSGKQFESMAFYTASASEEEMANYQHWRTSGEFRHFDPMKLFSAYLAYINSP